MKGEGGIDRERGNNQRTILTGKWHRHQRGLTDRRRETKTQMREGESGRDDGIEMETRSQR